MQTKDWSTSNVNGQKVQMFGGKPEVELRENDKSGSSSAFPVVDEPMPTSGGLFRCRYCRYTNAHKWKMASHMKVFVFFSSLFSSFFLSPFILVK